MEENVQIIESLTLTNPSALNDVVKGRGINLIFIAKDDKGENVAHKRLPLKVVLKTVRDKAPIPDAIRADHVDYNKQITKLDGYITQNIKPLEVSKGYDKEGFFIEVYGEEDKLLFTSQGFKVKSRADNPSKEKKPSKKKQKSDNTNGKPPLSLKEEVKRLRNDVEILKSIVKQYHPECTIPDTESENS